MGHADPLQSVKIDSASRVFGIESLGTCIYSRVTRGIMYYVKGRVFLSSTDLRRSPADRVAYQTYLSHFCAVSEVT